MEEVTFEDNELIAKFDGFVLEEDGMYRDRSGGDKTVRKKEDGFYYHSSWEWIMPVCKKFDLLTIDNERYIWYCDRIDNAVTKYEILPVFKILVEAINWYNIEYGTKYTN